MNNENVKRYSRQRECILNALEGTKLHPTANWIYDEVRKDISNISLGTIYRNLAKLCDDGIIMKLDAGDGAERYDFFSKPHYHLYCTSCGGVMDIDMDYVSDLDTLAAQKNEVEVDYHTLVFCGRCDKCNKKNN